MAERLNFGFLNRPQFLQQAQEDIFDVLVIGGGVTGAGIALDAASRGMKVCLVEKDDFASGTSGKSTKLIHGGLRYLKQFEFGLVKEVGKERAILHYLAPHLVVPEKMLLPLIKGGSLGKTMTSIGLYIYDFLAGVEDEDKRKMLDVDETLALEPLLPREKLLGGSIYAEYRTDDARLTVELIKSAFRYGVQCINYVKVAGVEEKNGKIVSANCMDEIHASPVSIRAKEFVNATGPWVDEIRNYNSKIEGKHLYLTKGVHVVVPHEKLPVRQSLYFDVPSDSRMMFTIPRDQITYIGTTDTYYSGNKDQIAVTPADREYLLNAVNLTFPEIALSENDIISEWAGLRPLIYEDGKSASEISRKDEIFEAPDGLISIAGGKLTGYRKMAERVVDLLVKRFKNSERTFRTCFTDKIPLTPSSFTSRTEMEAYEINLEKNLRLFDLGRYAGYLIHNYGKQTEQILAVLPKLPSLEPEALLLTAELVYTSSHEMAIKPEDFWLRRTGRGYFHPQTMGLLNLPMLELLVEKKILKRDQLGFWFNTLAG